MSGPKPLPVPVDEDRPFWEGTRRHQLLLATCEACGHVWFPPYARCTRCLSPERRWTEASGRGVVVGCTIFERPYLPSFADDLPYNVVLVQLEEGPLLYSSVLEVENAAIRVGMPVQVVFDDVSDTITLPRFRPAPAGGSTATPEVDAAAEPQGAA